MVGWKAIIVNCSIFDVTSKEIAEIIGKPIIKLQ